jgi:hypothetical protein
MFYFPAAGTFNRRARCRCVRPNGEQGDEMFKPITSKPIARMAAAACVALAVPFGIAASAGANDFASRVQNGTAQPNALLDSGRLAVQTKGNACSVHGWPNFEAKCQTDLREPAGEARIVRVIALR